MRRNLLAGLNTAATAKSRCSKPFRPAQHRRQREHSLQRFTQRHARYSRKHQRRQLGTLGSTRTAQDGTVCSLPEAAHAMSVPCAGRLPLTIVGVAAGPMAPDGLQNWMWPPLLSSETLASVQSSERAWLYWFHCTSAIACLARQSEGAERGLWRRAGARMNMGGRNRRGAGVEDSVSHTCGRCAGRCTRRAPAAHASLSLTCFSCC